MAKARVTIYPKAVQFGYIDLPDDIVTIMDGSNYIADHLDEVVYENPEIVKFLGAHFDCELEWSMEVPRNPELNAE